MALAQNAELNFVRQQGLREVSPEPVALIVGGSTIGDRTFAELRVQFIDGRHKPCVALGGTHAATVIACIRWINAADKTQLICANERRWLLRDSQT